MAPAKGMLIDAFGKIRYEAGLVSLVSSRGSTNSESLLTFRYVYH